MFLYIPLRNHTAYSLLHSSISVEKLVDYAVQHRLPALGMTDRHHLFGALDFSLACKKKNIHPIIGCEFSLYISDDLCVPFVLYASTDVGYFNLCALVSASTVDHKGHMREKITLAQVKNHATGLIALTGGPAGWIETLLCQQQVEAEKALLWLMDTFPQRLYVEIVRYESISEDGFVDKQVTEQRLSIEQQMITWAYEKNLPLLATNKAVFLSSEDYESYDVLCCIASNTYVHEEKRIKSSCHAYCRSPQEMERLFSDIPEAIEQTALFYKRCNFTLSQQKPQLPHFSTNISEEEIIAAESERGLGLRLEQEVLPFIPAEEQESVTVLYKKRLAYECNMIIQMGFAGYFLIVSDFIRWAKRQCIPVGPGRGSGASSLVAWALNITDINPIKFNLFFERFLNPERVSMPDFDVDFCQERREEVIAYVCEKYGYDRVAHIITFGSLQARAVLRDVGRVLQIPYLYVDKICKLVPQNPANPVHLAQALDMEPQLVQIMDEDSQIRQLITIALKLEGLYRHASVHAAGVIIGRHSLRKTLPLYKDEDAFLPATEYSMKYVESAGLVKFDFLGLKTLTVLQDAVNLIAENYQHHLQLIQIPLDDPATFALLRRVETVGIFQLESGGMSDVLRQLQPERFEEIIALVALYRPGPMDDIARYIACRHKREKVEYAFPCLEEILTETFGVMVYQEQVLQIARVLAGYSLGGADLLRRAMGKKIKAEMDAQRKVFIDGTIRQYKGMEQKASQLFDQIAKFAGYAFPKAHATPYALISYQTAYIKANYPVVFMTVLMIHDMDNTEKLCIFVEEAKRMGICVLPPDINASYALFSIEQGCIRYGLSALKGVGKNVILLCVEERNKNGPFLSIMNFMKRTTGMGINKKNLESLIMAGAFDSIHSGQRHALMLSLDVLLKYGQAAGEAVQYQSLFHTAHNEPVLYETEEWSPYDMLTYECQAVGFYLTGHPLTSYSSLPVHLASKVMEEGTYTMIGMVLNITHKIGKSGKKYGFLSLSDPSGNYELALFAEVLMQHKEWLTPGVAVLAHVTVKKGEKGMRMIASQLSPLEEHTFAETWNIPVSTHTHINQLTQYLSQCKKGRSVVMVEYTSTQLGTMVHVNVGAYKIIPRVHALLWKMCHDKPVEPKPPV